MVDTTLSKDKDDDAFQKKTRYFALSKATDKNQQPVKRGAFRYSYPFLSTLLPI